MFARIVDIEGYNDWMANTLVSYGIWRLGKPLWRRFAIKERTITVDALKSSFENPPGSSSG